MLLPAAPRRAMKGSGKAQTLQRKATSLSNFLEKPPRCTYENGQVHLESNLFVHE